MFYPLKIACIVGLLLLHFMTFAQQFDLKILVDRSGNPYPGGKPFDQYFYNYSVHEDVVITAGGRRHLFKSNVNCDGIRKNHLDAILWEIEKEMRCEVFKLYQIKIIVPVYDTSSNTMILFLQSFPNDSECATPIFYLWQQTAGRSLSLNYDFQTILAKMGASGKKYVKIIEENKSSYMSSPPLLKQYFPGNYKKQSFESLIEKYLRQNSGWAFNPGSRDYEQVDIVQMLEQKTPTEIVKYMLANNMVKAGNLSWFTLFLEMCDEWPPEAVDFLKKQYASPDPKYSSSIRDIIVAISFKNPEMVRWLKPYMAEFAAARTEIRKGTRLNQNGIYEEFSEPCGKMNSKVGAAYMLIAGESDPVKIARTYVFSRDGFIYEYAYTTGKYNDACSLIEKFSSGFSWRPQERSWRAPYAMLYDKSDLNTKNRIMLLKRFLLGSCIVKIPDTVYNSSGKKVQFVRIQDTSAEDGTLMQMKNDFLRECRLLHQDNLPALMELTKDAHYAPAAWLAVKAFPVKKMPPEVVAQYFAHCKQDLKSPVPQVRNEAIRCLRFFTPDEQRPEAVKMLFAMLLSSDPAAAAAANGSLAAMGPACMPELLETVSGKEPYFAVRACELIGDMGLYGQEATPELMKLLNSSSDWMLKTMIIKALALIKGTEAVPEIEKYVSDKQSTLAQTATQALVLLKPIPKEILNDPTEFVQNYSRPTSR